MLNTFYDQMAKLPNFKGKLFLLEKYYHSFVKEKSLKTLTWTGLKLDLYLQDRIQRRIFAKKSHELETERHILKFAKEATCFVDIGANIGYFSLMLAHKFPNLPVISFEPNPNNIHFLKKNIELNQLKNITLNEICLADKVGQVEFAVPPLNESGWGRIGGTSTPLKGFTKVIAKCETLDHMLEQGEFEKVKPSLLKMDIEGFEELALRGAESFLKKFKPILCIELNDPCLLENGSSSQNVMKYLSTLGYESFIINGEDLEKTSVPKEDYKFLNYFFIPKN